MRLEFYVLFGGGEVLICCQSTFLLTVYRTAFVAHVPACYAAADNHCAV